MAKTLRVVFTFPARHLISVIPTVILLALLCGRFCDTSFLKVFIFPVAMLTIYPAMIGLQPRELLRFTDVPLTLFSLLLNFLVLPTLAVQIGTAFLGSQPELYTGLLLISVVPGGNMAVAFTMLFKGNVKASLKISTGNLILGSLLAPLYLYYLAGTHIEINVIRIAVSIGFVVLIPLCLGVITHSVILKRIGEKRFKGEIKPLLPAVSVWGLIYLVFTSVSMKAPMIFSYPELLIQALASLLLWYCSILVICTVVARLFLQRREAISLLLNVELRNLPICIGIAVTAFPPQTAMMVSLAFLFQQQLAIWFLKTDGRYSLLEKRSS